MCNKQAINIDVKFDTIRGHRGRPVFKYDGRPLLQISDYGAKGEFINFWDEPNPTVYLETYDFLDEVKAEEIKIDKYTKLKDIVSGVSLSGDKLIVQVNHELQNKNTTIEFNAPKWLINATNGIYEQELIPEYRKSNFYTSDLTRDNLEYTEITDTKIILRCLSEFKDKPNVKPRVKAIVEFILGQEVINSKIKLVGDQGYRNATMVISPGREYFIDDESMDDMISHLMYLSKAAKTIFICLKED